MIKIYKNLFMLAIGVVATFLIYVSHATPSILDSFKAFLNSNFSTAFFGAAGGALAVLFIGFIRDQNRLLAEINTSIGMLASLSNTMLNIKEQHIQKLVENYKTNCLERELFLKIKHYTGTIETGGPFNFNMYAMRFHCPDLTFDAPVSRIFTKTNKLPQCVPIISQSKKSISDFVKQCETWNNIVEDLKNLDDDKRISVYFGDSESPSLVDSLFPDTVYNLEKTLDDALFFNRLSIRALRKLGKASLVFWLKNRIARSEITSNKHKNLMPSDEHLEGWKI